MGDRFYLGAYADSMFRPKRLGQHTIIDLSQANLDSLVTGSEDVQVIPTAMIKPEVIGYVRGRTVGMTQNWVAYAMSKGKQVYLSPPLNCIR